MMKKIALIYMGGTFGCVGEPLAPMPAEKFIPLLQRVLPPQFDIECFVSPVIKDSSACTAEDWLKLVKYIQELQQNQYQHFVIIHGTDTLSYASAVLAHCLGNSASVVLTGSQYPLLNVNGNDTREFTDATDNLNFALDSVSKCSSGVYLAFHHRLIHAQTALKRHTTELDAFTGIDANQAIYANTEAFKIDDQLIFKAQRFNCLNIMWQPISIDAQIQNLELFIENPPHVLILQGFGTGNIAVNDKLIQVLKSIQAKNCAVIINSQVPFGSLDQRYAVSEWITHAKFLVSNRFSHADLYAKALKMYLKYDSVEQWHDHWID
ncbi:asparaginase [Acinetobacter faecalis]|uniref:asparaginase n=1 Tax=Acinetobacter faecalis TaxID=2665161 RepID=UPI002A90D8FB|nr:asparaginase [Acinetobacter faecalis]MDY6449265.1 asparaginase [Acinetobacter faecalis]